MSRYHNSPFVCSWKEMVSGVMFMRIAKETESFDRHEGRICACLNSFEILQDVFWSMWQLRNLFVWCVCMYCLVGNFKFWFPFLDFAVVLSCVEGARFLVIFAWFEMFLVVDLWFCIGRTSVLLCKCWVFVSAVQPAAVLRAVFCIVWILLIFVLEAVLS